MTTPAQPHLHTASSAESRTVTITMQSAPLGTTYGKPCAKQWKVLVTSSRFPLERPVSPTHASVSLRGAHAPHPCKDACTCEASQEAGDLRVALARWHELPGERGIAQLLRAPPTPSSPKVCFGRLPGGSGTPTAGAACSPHSSLHPLLQCDIRHQPADQLPTGGPDYGRLGDT